MTDRYTHHVLTFLEGINKTSQATMQDLVRDLTSQSLLSRTVDSGNTPDRSRSRAPFFFFFSLSRRRQFDTFSYEVIHSTPGVRSDLFHRPLNETLLTDFFGGVSDVELADTFEHDDVDSFVREQLPDRHDLDQATRASFGGGHRRRRRKSESQASEPERRDRTAGLYQSAILVAAGVASVNVGAIWIARRRKL